MPSPKIFEQGASCKTQFFTDFKGNEIMQAFIFINFNFLVVMQKVVILMFNHY